MGRGRLSAIVSYMQRERPNIAVDLPYADRSAAGKVLAGELEHLRGRDDLLILALPRGGVPVGWEIARSLKVPFDVMLVRKLGVPGHEEMAMGAIASGGARFVNDDVVRQLGLSDDAIDEAVKRERQELQRREQAYRGDRDDPEVTGKTVVLVDDGLATGSSMVAAVRALRQRNPGRIIAAVPVAPPSTARDVGREVDEFICPATPDNFYAVGQWYTDFGQTTDDEVRNLLHRAWSA